MGVLADESCDFAIVGSLRAAGHDVEAMLEVAHGSPDARIIERAIRDDRVLLTKAKDFGRLVYAAGHRSAVTTALVLRPSTGRTAPGPAPGQPFGLIPARVLTCEASSSPSEVTDVVRSEDEPDPRGVPRHRAGG